MSFKEIASVYCKYHKEHVNTVHRKMKFSLGAFVKLREVTFNFVMSVVLFVCLSVCLYVCMSLCPSFRIEKQGSH
jgi:hypothetical protein